MVKDVPGQEDDAAMEFGVDYGLEEGEELPADIEELTEAQYTMYMMLQILKGTFEGGGTIKEIVDSKGTGIVVPS